jgi:hypothetical protein
MLRLGFISAAVALAACTSANPTPNAPRDSGAEGGGAEAGGATFTGKIFDLGQKGKAVPGATVSAAGLTATTDATGAYALNLPLNMPFTLTVTAPSYYKLIEQETLIKGGMDRGKTYLPSTSLGNMLNSTLPGYIDTLGGVGVNIEKQPSCPDEGGATFSWTVEGGPGGDAGTERLEYFSSGLPSPTAKATVKGSFPHGLIYNVTPGKKITVSVKHPTCTAVAFPVEVTGPFVAGDTSTGGSGMITFTSSSIVTEAGSVTSFVRVFLK